MAINYTTDIYPFYGTKVANDSAYQVATSSDRPSVTGTVVNLPKHTGTIARTTADTTYAAVDVSDDVVINGQTVVVTVATPNGIAADITGTTALANLGISAAAVAISGGFGVRISSANGTAITIAEGTADGFLAGVGMTAGTYTSANSPYLAIDTGDNIVINGTTVTSTGNDPTTIAADITGTTALANLGISASVETSGVGKVLKITSTYGNDLTIAEGTADGFLAGVGMTAGTYSATGTAALVDDADEQRILTTVEVVRSHFALVTTRNEAQMLFVTLKKLLAELYTQTNYTATVLQVRGNVKSPSFANADTMQVVCGSNTLNYTQSGSATLAQAVTALNLALAGASITEVEAVNIGNNLAFRNTTGNSGTSFTVGFASGNGNMMKKAGIDPQTVTDPYVTAVNSARTKAIAYFKKGNRNPTL